MISDRQKRILLAIIEEFMDSAEEIGSNNLIQKHDLGVSSATVRSEMVRLMSEGLLAKSHISSGRIPTDTAIRMYIDERARNSSISALDEIEIRQGIFSVRFSQEQLINQMLHILSNKCDSAAFYLTDDNRRYYGVSSLMKYDELRDLEVLQRVLDILEDENMLRKVFSKYNSDDAVSLIIGGESGIKHLENCSILFTSIQLSKDKIGHLGIIGPRRLDYKNVIAVIRTLKNSVEQSLRGWV
mgnify:CR=1 FL=1